MSIPGYVPAIGETDLDKIIRSIRNLYENGAASADIPVIPDIPDIPATPIQRGYIDGLTLSTAGSSATFSIAAGQAASSDQATMMTLAASISKTTGAWAVGSGNGSLDTGTIANSTWYHAWLIERTDTGVVDVLVSLSATAPTLPTSYTKCRRIGSMLTDGSAHWTLFEQLGDEFLWTTPRGDVSGVATSATPANNTISVPTGVQVLAKVIFNIFYSTAAVDMIVYPLDMGTQAANTPVGYYIGNVNSTLTNASTDLVMRTNTSGQIGSVGSGAGSVYYLVTYGWIDRRGRDA